MTRQNICVTIHGHFYQPPRENPWLGNIERQSSAYPYHDWNEKIAAACYTPNTVSRILDEHGRIDHIINNFSWMSFNIGPTLFAWLQRKLPRTAERIVAGDAESRKRNNGHGNAIAQVYNHVIMPLASRREKELQVRWAIADFRGHFGRDPEGMWLAETACNQETIEVLIDHGIRFTILAPSQAARVRVLRNPIPGSRAVQADTETTAADRKRDDPSDPDPDPSGGSRRGDWIDVSDGSVHTTRPYRLFSLDAKGSPIRDRSIDIFFFDRQLSIEVSFQHLLTSADRLGERLLAAARETLKPQLINIATDGETFGWHEPFADMCLAYFFENTAARAGVKVVNYAHYLDIDPPSWEVSLKSGSGGEGTSWSCVHGVGRWKEDCGCTTDSPTGWNQKWRTPLRRAFDVLRDHIESIWQVECTALVKDLDTARDDYIHILLNHHEDTLEAFWGRHLKHPENGRDRHKVLRMLEALSNVTLTYTSCAWFFGEVSRLEPVQNMKYALRAIELAQPFTDEDLQNAFLSELKEAHSNIPEMGNGRKIFNTLVKPAAFNMARVANSYAICLLTIGRASLPVHNYRVKEIDVRRLPDRYDSCCGLLQVLDRVTFEEALFAFHVTKFTVRDIRCYLKTVGSLHEYESLLESMEGQEISRLPDTFGTNYLSWSDMLPEVGGEIMRTLFDHNLKELREQFDRMFDAHKDLFEAYVTAGLELPTEVKGLVSFSLSRAFTDVIMKHRGQWEVAEHQRAIELQTMARKYGVELDTKEVEPLMTEDLLAEAQAVRRDLSPHRLANICKILELGRVLGLDLRRDLAENIVLEVLDEQVMPKIDALSDPDVGGRDFETYRGILGVLDWAEKLNFSKRRFEEKLEHYEEMLS